MQYILREIRELGLALLSMFSFYFRPDWLIKSVQKDNAIEFAMVNVKKSIALMIIAVIFMSLVFMSFDFVHVDEKPAEIFAVLLVHGAIVSAFVALLAWACLQNYHHVGLLMGWFILVYWIPLWIWNMVFEIRVGFDFEKNTNVFLQLAHEQSLQDWHVYFLSVTWLHATAVAVYGLHKLLHMKSMYLWLLGLVSSTLYMLSFLLIHRTHKGVEVVYLIFGMG